MKIRGILKDTAILGGGTGISQVLVLAASPVLTRIYTPEDFGVLAVFTAFLGILGGFSCMRYEQALPLAEDETEAANIAVLCGAILCAIVLSFCAFLLAFGNDLAKWLGSPALKPYIWLLPVGVFAAGMAQTSRLWAIRAKEFKRLASAGVVSSITLLTIQLGFGILRLGPAGLIFGRMGGTICNSLVLWPLLQKDVRPLLPQVRLRSVAEAARKHRQFPLFFSASAGLNSFGQEMPIIFLSLFFGPAITGLYALTRRTLSLPMLLVGGQLRKVFYAYAADEKRGGDLQGLTRSVFVTLVQIALPAAIILGVSAPELFDFVFGEQWHESGVYAQWLCPWLFIVFICAPLTRIPIIFEKQGKELIFQIVLLAMRALALVVGGMVQSVTITFALFGTVSFLCWVGFLIWSMHLINIKAAELLRILARETVIAVPIVAPLVLARFVVFTPDDSLWIVLASAGSAIGAALVLTVRIKRSIFPVLASR